MFSRCVRRLCSPVSSAAATEAALRRRIADLERQLHVQDNVVRELFAAQQQQHSVTSSSPSSSSSSSSKLHCPESGRFVVSSGDELFDAVCNGAHHILISSPSAASSSSLELFLPCPVSIPGDGHSLLLEPVENEAGATAPQQQNKDQQQQQQSEATAVRKPCNNTVKIVGEWKLESRAKLHVHGIDFEGSSPSRPLFFLSGGAHLVCHQCCFSDAREAVYLSSGSRAVLTKCAIQRNTRGVFESFRSKAKLVGCLFRENIFHAVLLATHRDDPKSQHPQRQLVQRLEVLRSMGNAFCRADETATEECAQRCRGDVAFSYNPMRDEYEDVYVDDVCVVLTETQSTTGLADESWQ